MQEDGNGIYRQYRVLRRADGSLWELGRGGMAVAYKAVDTGSDAVVALKVISPLFIDNDGARARFIREAEAAASLRHRNVARIHHLALDVRSCFYAMEFFGGETVEGLVERAGQLSWQAALALAIEVNAGLTAAHAAGLIHRDLKPANIMLAPAPDSEAAIVKLSDFALAEPAGDAGAIAGTGFLVTALYASPEQCRGDAPDIRSNIYSLALTWWYLLTGAPPFNAESKTLFWQHQHAPLPFGRLPRELPAALRALLGRMLAKKPGERPQTPAELAREMESCLPAALPPVALPAPSLDLPPAGLRLKDCLRRQGGKLPAATVANLLDPLAEIADGAPAGQLKLTPEGICLSLDGGASEAPHFGASFTDPLLTKGLPAWVEIDASSQENDHFNGAAALAGLVYELLGGVPPALEAPYRPLAECNAQANAAIQSALEDRLRSPSSAASFASRLGPTLRTPPKPARSRELLKMAATLMALLAFLAGAGSLLNLANAPRAQTLSAPPPLPLEPLLAKARAQMEAGQWQEAAQSYAQVLAQQPKSLEALSEGGAAYRFAGYPAKAQKYFSQAILLEPADAREHLCRADAYASLNQPDKARADYRAATALDVHDARDFWFRGHAYLGLRKNDMAVIDFSEAIRLDPQNAIALVDRGNALVNLEKYDDALRDFDQAVRVNPSLAIAWTGRGYVHSRRRDFALAVQDFDQSIRLAPQDPMAWNGRGVCRFSLQQAAPALEDFSQAFRLNAQDPMILFNRGTAYAALRKFDLAIADFTEAVKMNPQFAFAFRSRGAAYVREKQYDLALTDFDEAIRLQPANADNFQLRGNGYNCAEKYDLAVVDFDEAIRLNPKLAAAYTGRGYAKESLEDYEAALKDYAEAIRLDGKDAAAFDNRGRVYAALHKYERAIKDFNESIRLAPNFRNAYDHRAAANLALGHTAAARKDEAYLQLLAKP